jgi:hypothetical protein
MTALLGRDHAKHVERADMAGHRTQHLAVEAARLSQITTPMGLKRELE